MALPLASNPADAADNASAPIIPELDFIVFSFTVAFVGGADPMMHYHSR
jgi:hypothetical protein